MLTPILILSASLSPPPLSAVLAGLTVLATPLPDPVLLFPSPQLLPLSQEMVCRLDLAALCGVPDDRRDRVASPCEAMSASS